MCQTNARLVYIFVCINTNVVFKAAVVFEPRTNIRRN